MLDKIKRISPGVIARTLVLLLALINQCLTIIGKPPIVIADETITQFIALGFTIITALVNWWKNNSFTEPAIRADKIKEEYKKGGVS